MGAFYFLFHPCTYFSYLTIILWLIRSLLKKSQYANFWKHRKMGAVDAPKSIWTLSDLWLTRPPTASSFLLTKGAHTPQSLQGRAAMSPLEHRLGSLRCFLLLSRLTSECWLCPDGWCLWSAVCVRTGLEAGLLTPQAEPTAQPSEIWQIQCHLVHEPDQPSYVWTM